MATNPNEPINGFEVRTSQYADIPSTMMEGGLTKREYFAAMALNGMFSSDVEVDLSSKECAELAVIAADALIVELNKKKDACPAALPSSSKGTTSI